MGLILELRGLPATCVFSVFVNGCLHPHHATVTPLLAHPRAHSAITGPPTNALTLPTRSLASSRSCPAQVLSDIIKDKEEVWISRAEYLEQGVKCLSKLGVSA